MAASDPEIEFALVVDFAPGQGEPTRVFHAMSALIEACQTIDTSLCASVDTSISSSLVLQSIEVGSLKSILRYVFERVPDDAIRELNWKKIVGSVLLRGKHRILEATKDASIVQERGKLIELQNDLFEIAESAEIGGIPTYERIPIAEIGRGLIELSDTASHLTLGDKAGIETTFGETQLDLRFRASGEQLENLLTREVIDTEDPMILVIKKPDYLGDSMWEFRHGRHTISAKMLDAQWLSTFRSRNVDLRPRDAIRAVVRKRTHHDHDGEVIGEHFEILEVQGVIKQLTPVQLDMGPVADTEP